MEPEALRLLSAHAMTDIAHLLRPGHLQQLANILADQSRMSPLLLACAALSGGAAANSRCAVK